MKPRQISAQARLREFPFPNEYHAAATFKSRPYPHPLVVSGIVNLLRAGESARGIHAATKSPIDSTPAKEGGDTSNTVVSFTTN